MACKFTSCCMERMASFEICLASLRGSGPLVHACYWFCSGSLSCCSTFLLLSLKAIKTAFFLLGFDYAHNGLAGSSGPEASQTSNVTGDVI